MARTMMEVHRRERDRNLRLFDRVRIGMSERQVRRAMRRQPDWQEGDRWGFVSIIRVGDTPPRSLPSVVVVFEDNKVSGKYVQRAARESLQTDPN